MNQSTIPACGSGGDPGACPAGPRPCASGRSCAEGLRQISAIIGVVDILVFAPTAALQSSIPFRRIPPATRSGALQRWSSGTIGCVLLIWMGDPERADPSEIDRLSVARPARRKWPFSLRSARSICDCNFTAGDWKRLHAMDEISNLGYVHDHLTIGGTPELPSTPPGRSRPGRRTARILSSAMS